MSFMPIITLILLGVILYCGRNKIKSLAVYLINYNNQDNYFTFMNKDKDEFLKILKKNEFKCNAAGRLFMARRIKPLAKRQIKVDYQTLVKAEKVGGLKPKSRFKYKNAQGTISEARVCSLYDLPKKMVNPYLYVFSGFMTAPFFAMEILRFYAKQTGMVLPFFSSGQKGNKGLFNDLFYRRKKALIKKTEYDAYAAIMAQFLGKKYAYENYRKCDDRDTESNLLQLYEFALSKGLKEITFVICSGNPFYDKRLLAEWMWQLKNKKFSKVKINLVLVHCPIYLTKKHQSVPEGHLSEIYLGYIAACLGPLAKDTITFDGKTKSKKPERYLMRGVSSTKWQEFKDIIVNYSNMGWPDYQELLYGVPHEEAVANVILADLFARASFKPKDYDLGLNKQIKLYKKFLQRDYNPRKEELLDYLRQTPDEHFF